MFIYHLVSGLLLCRKGKKLGKRKNDMSLSPRGSFLVHDLFNGHIWMGLNSTANDVEEVKW